MPRRVPPPPPPPRRSEGNGGSHERSLSIADRLAALQLNQLTRQPEAPEPPARPKPPVPPHQPAMDDHYHDPGHDASGPGPPPPIPPAWTRPKPTQLPDALVTHTTKTAPPPPPKRNVPHAPPVPTRPAPRMPTSPPEPEPTYDESIETAGFAPSCIKCWDFSHVDEHASLFPRENVASLTTLAADLTEPFPTAIEKARAVFTWLHHNIAYDCASFFSGNLRHASPDMTLRSGVGVCDGYAGLFQHLANIAGLECRKVSGHGKGYGYVALGPDAHAPPMESNHAWNAVRLDDGTWHLIDPCWGAGVVQGTDYAQRFDPSWFTSYPAEFGKRHFPTNTADQLMDDEPGGPISWEDYILAPEGPLLFSDFTTHNFHQSSVLPDTRSVQGGQYIYFCVRKACEHMSTDLGESEIALMVDGDATSRQSLHLNDDGNWSAEIYVPSEAAKVGLYYLRRVSRGVEWVGLCQWSIV